MAKPLNLICLVFFLLVGFSSTGLAASAAAIDVNLLASGYDLTADLSFIEDTTGILELADLSASQWQPMNPENLTFGYTDSMYWFKVKLRNSSSDKIQRIIGIHYPVLDYIDIYQKTNDSEWALQRLGDKYPFDARPIDNRDFLIPLEMDSRSQVELVFRVQTSSSMQFPIRIWTERNFFESDQLQILSLGLYYGIMLVMVLYNFFLFLSMREANYLYYVCYVAFLALFLASLQGLSFQFLWPQATQWNDSSIIVFLAATIFFGILFTRNFLHINHIRSVNIILIVLCTGLLSIIALSSVVPYHVLIQTVIVLAFACLNMAFIAGIVRWVQGYATARYYTIAWFLFLLGSLILALNKFNFIPRNIFSENIIQIGSAAEVILLSFALADRLNREKKKRYEAQLYALDKERQAREAQQEILKAQQEANETLEQRVKERTLELEEANKQLGLMSITDALTNIRNRRYFDRTLKLEMARAVREQEAISVLIIDVDYFKKINDTYGHQVGDTVLRGVANTLSQLINRSTDLLARFGGEEFVVILPNTTIQGAAHVAECVRSAISELTFKDIAEDLNVRVSIGVYGDVPTQQSHHETWIKNADEALYQAKENGRDQVVVYVDEEVS